MPPPSVTAVHGVFLRQVNQSVSLLASVRRRGTPFFQLEQIAELVYLRVYSSWETFLEESFIRFMCGAPCASGSRPKCYVKPRNIEHARELIIGPRLRYADWTDPDVVIERAELVFSGGRPYGTPVRAAVLELNDMRAIRNCIAHRSVDARNRFGALVQRRLGVARKLGPGRFLLRQTATPNQSYLEFFASCVVAVAQQVSR
jgi:hypothetical protein